MAAQNIGNAESEHIPFHKLLPSDGVARAQAGRGQTPPNGHRPWCFPRTSGGPADEMQAGFESWF